MATGHVSNKDLYSDSFTCVCIGAISTMDDDDDDDEAVGTAKPGVGDAVAGWDGRGAHLGGGGGGGNGARAPRADATPFWAATWRTALAAACPMDPWPICCSW